MTWNTFHSIYLERYLLSLNDVIWPYNITQIIVRGTLRITPNSVVSTVFAGGLAQIGADASAGPLMTNSRIPPWGQVTHMGVSKIAIIVSGNGLSPNAGVLSIRTLGANSREIFSEIHTFPFTKMHLKIKAGKWRPFCRGLSVINKALTLKEARRVVFYSLCTLAHMYKLYEIQIFYIILDAC